MTLSTRPRPPRCRVLAALGLLTLVVASSAPVGTASAEMEGPAARSAAASTGKPVDDPVDPVGQLIVKLVPGADVAAVNRRLGSTTKAVLLHSRGIYLLDVPLAKPHPNDAKRRAAEWSRQVGEIRKELDHQPGVVYIEANSTTGIGEGSRFHHWPSGGPSCTGWDSTGYLSQPATERLRLARAHGVAQGKGRIVAVLDGGVDLTHPVLAGRIAPGGYDYVDDDGTPGEVLTGQDLDGDGQSDEGYGHGTFVAGIVSLTAPQGRILPLRVLDAEGRGTSFGVAEALYDAVAAGADVINLSFGTTDKVQSKVLDEAMKAAEKAGAMVVAAAGNDASTSANYPAAMSGVISVAAQADRSSALASFSSRGDWVDLAAPGEQVVSTLPCGYGSWSGTSMAAPFVSGGVALLGELEPRAKPKTIRQALDDGCDQVRGLQVHSGALNLTRSLDRFHGDDKDNDKDDD